MRARRLRLPRLSQGKADRSRRRLRRKRSLIATGPDRGMRGTQSISGAGKLIIVALLREEDVLLDLKARRLVEAACRDRDMR